MKKPVFTVGIVGLGKIAVGYDLTSKSSQILSHAKATLRHPQTKLLWGVDLNKSARNSFEKYTRVKAYTSVAGLGLAQRPDILVVAVPTANHLEVLRESLKEFTPRLVLMEKPLAYSEEEAQEIVKLCQDKNISLVVNYHLRFDPAILKILKLIRAERFGALQSGHAYYSKGMGNACSYYLNLLSSLYGLPDHVSCHGIKRDLFSGADCDVDFSCVYDQAPFVFQSVNANNFNLMELDLIFARGRVRLFELNEKIACYQVKKHKVYAGYRELLAVKTDQPQTSRYQYHVLDHIVRGLVKGQDFSVEARDALMAVQVMSKVKHAAINHIKNLDEDTKGAQCQN